MSRSELFLCRYWMTTIVLCLLSNSVSSLSESFEDISEKLKFIENEDGDNSNKHVSAEEKKYLKEEAKEMFFHAYNSYMENAYPADELMPLSCKGRWRDTEVTRGDIDEILGNFSLTLVDSLDTLVIMGDLEEFEHALKLIIRDVSFDRDVVVSLFETNIRMVGGLISGHILADHIHQLYGAVSWYRGELLAMAQDLATRLLPAFNTTTGIPYPRVNLKHGMKCGKLEHSRDTCTACAGTIILEFASLSRLTGEPIFEEKARQAMDYLWSQRHRGTDLMGTILNIHSGDWVRRDSGVGAGIDSYYEYLLKAYVLLGDEGYLNRFNKHYNAVMKYVSQGPMLLDVHMHRPHTTSRHFMDSLLAFWPGLQVLKGDIKPAIETHEMLYQVTQRHNFLPEAFTTDFQVHWGQHPLRPEFVESTYLLYQATSDPYYLSVGKQILQSLQKHAWVPCGYAAVQDVRTGVLEDRMDSFVLSETFKYLYLLFAERADHLINLDEFIFTTEAHLLPLSLARLSNLTTVPLPESMPYEDPEDPDVEYSRSCPNAQSLFPGRKQFAENIRKPLKNYVRNICPSRKQLRRKLRASEFQAGNAAHMTLLKDMGIALMTLQDGRVQLLHTSANSKTTEDAEEGLLFMQEMIALSKLQQDQPENPPRSVTFYKPTERNDSNDNNDANDANDHQQLDYKTRESVTLIAGPAQFGRELNKDNMVSGRVVRAAPLKACGKLDNEQEVVGRIVIMERGSCMFIEKARAIESAGALGGIVVDSSPSSSSVTSPMFAMSGDGNNDVNIPLVFLFSEDAKPLLKAVDADANVVVVLADYVQPVTAKSATTAQYTPQVTEKTEDVTGPTVTSILKKRQNSDFQETVDGVDDPENSSDLVQEVVHLMGAGEEVESEADGLLKDIQDLLKRKAQMEELKGILHGESSEFVESELEKLTNGLNKMFSLIRRQNADKEDDDEKQNSSALEDNKNTLEDTNNTLEDSDQPQTHAIGDIEDSLNQLQSKLSTISKTFTTEESGVTSETGRPFTVRTKILAVVVQQKLNALRAALTKAEKSRRKLEGEEDFFTKNIVPDEDIQRDEL